MEQTTLNVQLRTDSGKGHARKLRASGRIPAVLHRGREKPVHLTLDPALLEKSIRGGVNTLLKLEVEGGGEPSGEVALLKELQRHPVKNNYMHADFIQVDLKKPMEVEVSISLEGHPEGVTQGGILEPIMRQVKVRCLPAAIPHHVSVDVSALNIGDSVHVKDLVIPEDVECLEDESAPVATVSAPKVEEEPTAAEEEGEAAEGEGEAAEGAPAEGDQEKKEGAEEEKKD